MIVALKQGNDSFVIALLDSKPEAARKEAVRRSFCKFRVKNSKLSKKLAIKKFLYSKD